MTIHWTYKLKIRSLFKQGFTDEELAIMYHIPWSEIRRIIYGIKKPERI